MPLHEKDSIRDNLDDEVYGSADLSVAMPKYKFPVKRNSGQYPGVKPR